MAKKQTISLDTIPDLDELDLQIPPAPEPPAPLESILPQIPILEPVAMKPILEPVAMKPFLKPALKELPNPTHTVHHYTQTVNNLIFESGIPYGVVTPSDEGTKAEWTHKGITLTLLADPKGVHLIDHTGIREANVATLRDSYHFLMK